MKISIDYSTPIKPIGPMNAVNNGPVYIRTPDQNVGTLDLYKAANIPFARTHDASFFYYYGGEHTVDVHAIFPNFDADPEDPASYDFHLTDEYMETIHMANTDIVYRLGSRIEHESKKYGTVMPPDFQKWAVICEHIIAHLNYGWADGHHFGIKYWEIWNEPDMCEDDAPYERHTTWSGTRAEYFVFYETAAKHLKACYPDLMIGGPATCRPALAAWDLDFATAFLSHMKEHNAPLDFFSWHCYHTRMQWYKDACRKQRELLDAYGFFKTESHCNEWNYVSSFSDEGWVETLRTDISIKGAAFIAGVMTVCQDEPIDMMMYYDARPFSMNGLFKSWTYDAHKGYYSVKAWGELLALGTQCKTSSDIPDVYVVGATGKDGESMAMITYYTDDDKTAVARTFAVEVDCERMYTAYLLDEEHDMERVEEIFPCDGKFTLTMEPNTVIVLK